MRQYDFMLAGKWRNREGVEAVLKAIRNSGKTVYCFLDNAYDGDNIKIDIDKSTDVEAFMRNLETIEDWQSNATFRKIFENDMNGIKSADAFVMVFPAGLSSHMELGAAYGLGKKCYGIGKPDKYETLYLMFDEIFPDIETFVNSKLKQVATV